MTKNNPWVLIKRVGQGVDSERVDPQSQFDFFWAVNKDGTYQFLIEHDNLEDWPARKITLAGIDIQQFQTSKKYRITLSLNETSDWDIFYILCDDLLHASEESTSQKSMLNIVYNRLLRWQKLFRKFGKKLLSEIEQQGLVGELYLLKNHLLTTFTAREALSFWRGPFGEQQDFGLGNIAIEVKSKQGTSAPYIQISTIDQLECQLENLFLYVVTLNTAPNTSLGSFSLNQIIEDIKSTLNNPNDIDVFENLLAEAGYMDLPEYSEKYYHISNESIYEVKDEFPRLQTKNIPDGVIAVQYKIEIKSCKPYAINMDDFKKRIANA